MTARTGVRFLFNFCGKKHCLTRTNVARVTSNGKILTNEATVTSDNSPSIYAVRRFVSCSNALFNSQVRQPTQNQVSQDAIHNFAAKINWPLPSDEVLINAITHKSYVSSDTQISGSSFLHSERLIFLGYQTVSSFVTEILYFKYPSLAEDQLWDVKNALLQEDLLEKCGRSLGLPDVIFAKDEITGKIIADTLLAIVGSLNMDQTPSFARQFVENFIVPDITEEMIKELCQLEHPKFMLKMLTPKEQNITAKVLEEHLKENVYGEEIKEYKIGIFNNEQLHSEGYGDSQLSAEKNACREVLMANYYEQLKKAKFPLDYENYETEHQVNFGLLTEGVRLVEIEKGDGGFGFLIKGGEMRTEENEDYLKCTYYFPPFISGIIEGGPAERFSNLKIGDVVLAINDKNTEGMSHQSVVNVLNSIKGKVKLVVKYDKKVLITDEIERKFSQFKERKLLSQLTDPEWSEWHYAHAKKNEQEYEKVFEKTSKSMK